MTLQVILVVNYESTTALRFSPFTTYHSTSTDTLVFNIAPAFGDVITAGSAGRPALMTGVISDSRATVETIKPPKVNRIVLQGIL